jgi:hypothetical protein
MSMFVKNPRLNEGSEEIYKPFNGKSYGEIPLLIAEGRLIMDGSQLMKKRLEYRNIDKVAPMDFDENRRWRVGKNWLDNGFSLGDAAAYHPDGKVKILLDSPYLRGITKETHGGEPLSLESGGRFPITEEDYQTFVGDEFTRDELDKIGLEKKVHLSKKQAKNLPIWKMIARDSDLSDEYINYVFAELGERRFAMGFTTPDYSFQKQSKTPIIVPLIMGSVSNVGRSFLDGGIRLADTFVGIKSRDKTW